MARRRVAEELGDLNASTPPTQRTPSLELPAEILPPSRINLPHDQAGRPAQSSTRKVTIDKGSLHTNCVMQSDGNSFYGDVVLESFNKTSRDEDNILDQI